MENSNTKIKLYIDYMKCLAVLLVLNSHLDNIYLISAFASGGGD